MAIPTFLFVPNIIGYLRIILGVAAFRVAGADDPSEFFALYFLSYALDALDGVAARHLKQTSRFGAVLDMVTDRACTAALLAALASVCKDQTYAFCFHCLLMLDIVSHWAQMYSSLAVGASSHKSLADEPALLKFYYTYPKALFFVCLLNEGFLATAFLYFSAKKTALSGGLLAFMADDALSRAGQRLGIVGTPLPLYELLMYVCFPVFAMKQLFSVLQLGKAAQRILALDDAARAAAVNA